MPVNISAGEQFRPEFPRISPNNRIPAIVDHAPADGGEPLALFESGAILDILEYLADKTGQRLDPAPRPRFQTLQWLDWQMAGLGPMAGQNHHFAHYAPERIDDATRRFVDETSRRYRVLDIQLADRDTIAGTFSIADSACDPWIRLHERQGQRLADFPHLQRWFERLSARAAVIRAYRIAESINTAPTVTAESHRYLFGQRSDSPHRTGRET